MPPKKKDTSKKKSKKGSSSDLSEGIDFSLPENKVKFLEAQKQSLQIQLAHRSDINALTTNEYNQMKQSLSDAVTQLDDAKERTVRLTKDMTRQYKGMQDDLLNKINLRERSIQNLKDSLEEQKREAEVALQIKDDVIKEKDMCIKGLEEKMEDLCETFATMLQDALMQMKERIEVQSACYNETSVPIQHRMEEFNFRASSQS